MTWCMVYTEHAERTRPKTTKNNQKQPKTTKKRCKYTTSLDIHSLDRHSFRITCNKSAVSLLESGE